MLQEVCGILEKQKMEFLQLTVKVLKSIFHGNFDNKIASNDVFVISSNKTFLEKHISGINIKKMKKVNLLELLTLISSKSDSMLLKALLKYRTQI